MIPLALLSILLLNGRLEFTKVFPRSNPPYVAISVDGSGTAEFKTDPQDEQPIKFHLSSSEVAELFALADKVDLSQALESPIKVAFMGTKTIRYTGGSKSGQQAYNFTENPDARALTDWLERISESEQCFIDLERSVKYEKIGVNQSLLLLQVAWERKRLVAPQQFLPLLDRVVKSDSYIQMARKRAEVLAETFREIK